MRQIERENRQKDIETDRERHRDRQRDIETDRERQRDIETHRETDRERHRETDRETECRFECSFDTKDTSSLSSPVRNRGSFWRRNLWFRGSSRALCLLSQPVSHVWECWLQQAVCLKMAAPQHLNPGAAASQSAALCLAPSGLTSHLSSYQAFSPRLLQIAGLGTSFGFDYVLTCHCSDLPVWWADWKLSTLVGFFALIVTLV